MLLSDIPIYWGRFHGPSTSCSRLQRLSVISNQFFNVCYLVFCCGWRWMPYLGSLFRFMYPSLNTLSQTDAWFLLITCSLNTIYSQSNSIAFWSHLVCKKSNKISHFYIHYVMVTFIMAVMSYTYVLNIKVALCLFVHLFVWVLWNINLCRLINAKSIFIPKNSSISNNSV